MFLDAFRFWKDDSLLSRPFNVFWQEQGVYYNMDSDFDLCCLYCMMSV